MAKIDKIVVVGGGTAGWMTAATLIHHFPERDISVIESPNIPTVGVGESTIGQINAWLHDLDIKDEDWMQHCDASYKLSIKFTDFYKENSGGFQYPFGAPYIQGTVFGINDWYFKKAQFPDTPNSNYAVTYYPAVALLDQNKITTNEDGGLPGWRFDNDTAYHFDAAKFGIWLRDTYCKTRGVKHIVAEVTDTPVNNDGIEHLMLTTGEKVTADLYIDCTGFKSLLLDKALKVPFNKLDHILPNNSAWATRIPYKDKSAELQPYTNCTAIENGWVWNIPLWSRVGTGYVYSDAFVSDADALLEFKKHLMTTRDFPISQELIDTLEFKNIKMRVGLHEEVYYKNVCAIGLSAGFIEPLESNGLFTVHEFLQKLAKTIRRESISQWDKDCFNTAVSIDFNSFAEFVSLHYALSQRDQTPYWRSVSNRKFKSKNKTPGEMSGFERFMLKRMHQQQYDYDIGGIACIAPAMGFFPIDASSIKRSMFTNNHEMLMDVITNTYTKWNEEQQAWKEIADAAPTLYEFLANRYNAK